MYTGEKKEEEKKTAQQGLRKACEKRAAK
jgi:hypothetical protein